MAAAAAAVDASMESLAPPPRSGRRGKKSSSASTKRPPAVVTVPLVTDTLTPCQQRQLQLAGLAYTVGVHVMTATILYAADDGRRLARKEAHRIHKTGLLRNCTQARIQLPAAAEALITRYERVTGGGAGGGSQSSHAFISDEQWATRLDNDLAGVAPAERAQVLRGAIAYLISGARAEKKKKKKQHGGGAAAPTTGSEEEEKEESEGASATEAADDEMEAGGEEEEESDDDTASEGSYPEEEDDDDDQDTTGSEENHGDRGETDDEQEDEQGEEEPEQVDVAAVACFLVVLSIPVSISGCLTFFFIFVDCLPGHFRTGANAIRR